MSFWGGEATQTIVNRTYLVEMETPEFQHPGQREGEGLSRCVTFVCVCGTRDYRQAEEGKLSLKIKGGTQGHRHRVGEN